MGPSIKLYNGNRILLQAVVSNADLDFLICCKLEANCCKRAVGCRLQFKINLLKAARAFYYNTFLMKILWYGPKFWSKGRNGACSFLKNLCTTMYDVTYKWLLHIPDCRAEDVKKS